ncbi:hypothetical protein BT96DRAFT_856728 [Gymnopus androsaceus JB14]|uniref:Uncharacterized protein n=1 Tax=Gymnopus androsaceus JB14 TaxID=1447944 RepID=A0A6A4HRX0_9AGAR|nr:hypothetical protein BT96DRAFT_856728 [Gymnopus androsaceus JB14]
MTPYNVTINSQTANLVYKPYKDGDLSGGWNLTYTLVPDGAAPETTANGTSYHRTTFPGASMALTFTGTDIYLYGNASAGSYSVAVDGGTATQGANDVPQGGLLDAVTSLSYGNHSVTLTSTGTNEVAFQYADVTIGIPGTPELETILAITATNARSSGDLTGLGRGFNPFFSFANPGWNFPNEFEFMYSNPAGNAISIVPRVSAITSSSSVKFTLANTSAFLILGPLNDNHGIFQVTMIPDGDTNNQIVQTGNGSSFLSDPQQILFWHSGMDETIAYVIEVTNTANDAPQSQNFFSLGIRALVTVSSTTSSAPETVTAVSANSKILSNGAVAGITLGAVAMVLGVITALTFLCRRSYNRIHVGPFETNDTPLQQQTNRPDLQIQDQIQSQVYVEDTSTLPPVYTEYGNNFAYSG